MFSTIPIIFTYVFIQKFIYFLTSFTLRFYPVVISIAPSFYLSKLRSWTMEICSSLVPGGVSIIK